MTMRETIVKAVAAAVLGVAGWVGNSAWSYVTASITDIRTTAAAASERATKLEVEHTLLREWLERIERKLDRVVENSTPRRDK